MATRKGGLGRWRRAAGFDPKRGMAIMADLPTGDAERFRNVVAYRKLPD